MTFVELQRGVADDMQYQAQPKPGVQDRIRRYLNEGLERVLRRTRLKQLRLITLPLTPDGYTIAGEAFYGLPELIERVDYVIDVANGRRLPFRSRDWYRHLDPSLKTTGTPSVWIPEGIGPVIRQPKINPATNLTDIYVRSIGPEDTTQTALARVSYFLGNEITIGAKLQGTTPVLMSTELGGPTTILQLALDATTTNYVQFSDVAVVPGYPQVLGTIQPPHLTSRHLGLRLYPTPSARMGPYEVEGQRVIPRMTQDWDQPPFSADFHEMLQCYARARFYRKDGRLQQAREEMAEFERYALDLTAHVEYPPDYRPVTAKLSTAGRGWSNLGSWYPADHGWRSD